MNHDARKSIGAMEVGLMVLVFVSTLTLRVWGIEQHFWLLRDQIRDWSIALGPFSDLPLVGPATHVHGYTIGPAFYWILWVIRVAFGPWFDNLPHAGGIGQAALHSTADALLLLAVWRRLGSVWIALTAVVLLATAAYDLCFAALVWNPTMGTTLAKFAIALVLMDWHRRSAVHAAITAAVAWSAVHAYTGAIFVAVGVLGASLLDPLVRGERSLARRNAIVVLLAVVLLQLPLVAHQFATGFGDPAMDAVTGGIGSILAGRASPEFAKSATGYVGAFQFIQLGPWQWASTGVLLLASAIIVIVRHRRDSALLLVMVLPGSLAIAGYAFFLGALDHYYYLSLMPSAVLTVLATATAIPWRQVRRAVGVVLLAGALAIIPARVRFSYTMHKLPEYGAIVHGSRVIAARGTAMKAVRTAFRLPPTCDPEFVYRILGGRLDPASPWVGVIAADGSVTYENADEIRPVAGLTRRAGLHTV